MRTVREHLAQARKLRYRYQKECWFLDAARDYRQAVGALAGALDRGRPRARAASSRSASTCPGTPDRRRSPALAGGHRAGLRRTRRRAVLRQHQGQPGQGHPVRGRGRLQRGGRGDVREVRPRRGQGLPRRVPRTGRTWITWRNGSWTWWPGCFPTCSARSTTSAPGMPAISTRRSASFDREVQFYAAYLDFIAPMKAAGLEFCYPRVSAGAKEISGGRRVRPRAGGASSCPRAARWCATTSG